MSVRQNKDFYGTQKCSDPPTNSMVTVGGLDEIVTGLNPNKAKGPDQISSAKHF